MKAVKDKSHQFLKQVIDIYASIIPGRSIWISALEPLLKDLNQQSKYDNSAKVECAVKALTEASELVDELQTDISERAEKMAKIQEQYEHYIKLSAVSKEDSDVLVRQINETFVRGRSRERWIAFCISLIAGILVFVLGIFFGPKITTWFGH